MLFHSPEKLFIAHFLFAFGDDAGENEFAVFIFRVFYENADFIPLNKGGAPILIGAGVV